MTQLAKFHKAITLFLCILYIFTGSGLDKLTFRTVSLIKRSVVFPCKGKGCQCDKAGYELLNCQCDHENNISCCSTETPEKEESCCSEDIQDEESCCSEEPVPSGPAIQKIPCQGVEDNSIYTLGKHIVLLPPVIPVKVYTTEKADTPYSLSYINPNKLPSDKVPIFS